MQSKFQEVMSFLQFEIVDGRVICLYRCSTGPTQALGCGTMHVSISRGVVFGQYGVASREVRQKIWTETLSIKSMHLPLVTSQIANAEASTKNVKIVKEWLKDQGVLALPTIREPGFA